MNWKNSFLKSRVVLFFFVVGWVSVTCVHSDSSIHVDLNHWKFCSTGPTEECFEYDRKSDLFFNLHNPSKKGTFRIVSTFFLTSDQVQSSLWLFLGEVADNIAVALNGNLIAEYNESTKKTYLRPESIILPLPKSFLKSGENKLEFELTDLNQTIFGIRSQNVYVSNDYLEVLNSQRGDWFLRTNSNLLTGYSLLILFFCLLVVYFYYRSSKILLLSGYCAVTLIYLISFSEIPRQYFSPILFSGPVHFTLRLLQDLILFLNIFVFLDQKKGRLTRDSGIGVYCFGIALLWVTWWISPTYLPQLRLMQTIAILVALPMIYGFYCTIRFKTFGLFLQAVFFVLLAMQINDLFVFWQMIQSAYFVKWYPPFTILLLMVVMLRELIRDLNQKQSEAALAYLASQVAHDIRSPLSALDMVVQRIALKGIQIPEEDRIMVRNAAGRIRDIAHQLLTQYSQKAQRPDADSRTQSGEEISNQFLSGLIDPLVSEKRMQYRSKIGISIENKLDHQCLELFAKVQPIELKRVLSNLINNSVEAMDGSGSILLSLRASSTQNVDIVIQDNGKGIPKDILARMGVKGESFGKKDGSGLGIYHARQSVESWNGQLIIESSESTPENGTRVILRLPKSEMPSWFVSRLILDRNSNLIIVDDDPSIHNIWQGRMDSLGRDRSTIQMVHLSTPAALKEYISIKKESDLFLMDYEFVGSQMTGLDLIEEYSLKQQSLLVTSRFEETHIRNRCIKLGVRMIPKNLAGFVQIEVLGERVRADAVYIDDDRLMIDTWTLVADQKNKKLFCFHPNEAQFRMKSIHKDTPIYIDATFLDGTPGEKIAYQLHCQGFTQIYFATGQVPGKFLHLKYLKGILGKDPPW